MRYLRMLSNSVITGGLASAYLTALVLQLNPAVQIDPGSLLVLALVLGVAYGANLTIGFYSLIVFRQILAVEVLSPGWLSVRLLSWLCTIAAGGGAALMWMNLTGFAPVLDPETRSAMFNGAAIVSACGLVFLSIGLSHLGRRGGRVSAMLLSATMVMSVGTAGGARPGQSPPLPTFIRSARRGPFGVDRPRAPLDVRRRVARRHLSRVVAADPPHRPHFRPGRAAAPATLRPTQAEPVWSAIATGRLPMSNGVRSAVLYRVAGGVDIRLLPDYCFMQALVLLVL